MLDGGPERFHAQGVVHQAGRLVSHRVFPLRGRHPAGIHRHPLPQRQTETQRARAERGAEGDRERTEEEKREDGSEPTALQLGLLVEPTDCFRRYISRSQDMEASGIIDIGEEEEGEEGLWCGFVRCV